MVRRRAPRWCGAGEAAEVGVCLRGGARPLWAEHAARPSNFPQPRNERDASVGGGTGEAEGRGGGAARSHSQANFASLQLKPSQRLGSEGEWDLPSKKPSHLQDCK